MNLRAGYMVQGVKTFVVQASDLSLIPGTHIKAEEEFQFHQLALRTPYMHCGMNAPHIL